jgi:uncharacterized protein YggU (UPF0235/DUF167 family)
MPLPAASRDGFVVAVVARPRARRDAIAGCRSGARLIDTMAAPADGAANVAIRRLVAAVFGARRADLALASGSSSRRRRFRPRVALANHG